MKKEKIAVGYIRVSRLGTKYEEKESPRMQENEIKAYCKRENYTLTHIYQDLDYTGGNDERPDFKLLFHDIESEGEVDAVIVYNLSRFSRNLMDVKTYLERLDNNNVSFISCTEPIFNQQDPSLKNFMINLFGTIAEYQRDQIRQTVKHSMLSKSKSGVHLGGKVLFGYKLNDERKYVIEEDKAKVVQFIFNRYLDGQSPAKISEEISTMNIVDPNLKFEADTIRAILSNEKYTGKYVYGRDRYNELEGEDGEYDEDNEEFTIIHNNHPSIITKQQFLLVQEEVKKRGKNNKKATELENVRGKNLLTGKVRCGYCGSHYYVSSSSSAKTYYYYMCSDNNDFPCKQKKIRKIQLENVIFNALEEKVTKEELFDFYREEYSRVEDQIAVNSENIPIIKKKIKDLEKMKNYYNEKMKRAFDKEDYEMEHEYEKNVKKYVKEINDLHQRLLDHAIQFERKDIPDVEEIIQTFNEENFNKILFLKSLTFSTVKKIMASVIEEIVIDDIGNSDKSKISIKYHNGEVEDYEIQRGLRNLPEEDQFDDQEFEYESLILITNVMKQMKENGWDDE
ncbi:recombinase family protein [Virgibacillus salarius]|uniref:recombinase family protein n=1 Tax=Virgibacillus salarius TaxID=447199 RepID=UPI00042A4172|nr:MULTISPECIES: recombinase family protein [Bacillaceae]WBX80319.1 recombinase family protein [Virgibacillus salarius]